MKGTEPLHSLFLCQRPIPAARMWKSRLTPLFPVICVHPWDFIQADVCLMSEAGTLYLLSRVMKKVFAGVWMIQSIPKSMHRLFYCRSMCMCALQDHTQAWPDMTIGHVPRTFCVFIDDLIIHLSLRLICLHICLAFLYPALDFKSMSFKSWCCGSFRKEEIQDFLKYTVYINRSNQRNGT